MKRYIRSSKIAANGNAVAIAEYAFGDYFREDYRIHIYKQTKGYAVKYFAHDGYEGQDDADAALERMLEVADDLNIPVIRSDVKRGYRMGSVSGYVACVVVPAAGVEASTKVQAGIGSGRRSVWYIGQYPDRNRVKFDGYKTYGFASEEEAQAAIDELYEIDYYVENYPGLRPMHKFEYNVYHD